MRAHLKSSWRLNRSSRRCSWAWLIGTIAMLLVFLIIMVNFFWGKHRRGEGSKTQKVGIAVVIMPSPGIVTGPMTRTDRLMAIRDTWAQDLLSEAFGHDAGPNKNYRVVFVLDEIDPATGVALGDLGWKALEEPSIKDFQSLPTELDSRVLVVPTNISRGGRDGDARLRYALDTVNAAFEPDFLFFCNEHTFVIAENLRCFVRDFNPAKAVYIQNQFREEDALIWIDQVGSATASKETDKIMANSGAGGVLLSRGSLAVLQRAWNLIDFYADSVHQNHWGIRTQTQNAGKARLACLARSKFERENPGISLTRCLKHFGVDAKDGTDDEGGQRLNLYGPVRLAQRMVHKLSRGSNPIFQTTWHDGLWHCSKTTVSFHYVGPTETRTLHYVIHNRKKYLTEGYEEVFNVWPISPEDLGAHSTAPRRGDRTFDLLLRKIQLCEGKW